MKKFLAIAVLAVMSLGFALSAQANVLKTSGSYVVKYSGLEYLFWNNSGTSKSFIDGDVAAGELLETADLMGPGGLTTGFEMASVAYISTITKISPTTGREQMPSIYSGGNGGGLYVAVLTGLRAIGAERSPTNPMEYKMSFSGGRLDWYHMADQSTAALNEMYYKPGVGIVVGEDEQVFTLSEADRFLSYNLRPASNTISVDEMNTIRGDVGFYADVTDDYVDSYWDTDGANGNGSNPADMYFSANLEWLPGFNALSFNDPASLKVVTPEPGTVILMGFGLLLTGLYIRRQRKVKDCS